MNSILYTRLLTQIYGSNLAVEVTGKLLELVERYRKLVPIPRETALTERDSILITYGDQVREKGQPPLQTLAVFCEKSLRGTVSGIHILPFYPWSSDDGFAVKDYRQVDKSLGSWNDVERIGNSFRLMFDGVINHVSSQCEWFRAFLRDEEPYRNYFITVEGNHDLSGVFRPRARPLLTEYQTLSGPRRVWTTFSDDQVDLNFHNPEVLLEIFDILLMYVQHGAQFLRLDAVAYLWKEIGTSCIHLQQTHAVIQLLRAVLDDVAPHVYLITETNVPHQENISYFGDGTNESQLVYNFALPPLILHTFRTEDVSALSRWAAELSLPSNRTTFFNFLASHDGIGLNPARGIIPHADIDGLVEQTRAHGGLISYKQNPDGSQSPYEININYFDALSNPISIETLETQVCRFLAAQFVMLSLAGIPGIYFHSLFGSRGWLEGVGETGRNRTINRQKTEMVDLEKELMNPSSQRAIVFSRYTQLLRVRARQPAFHPHAPQKVLLADNSTFALLRSSIDSVDNVICLVNVSNHPSTAQIDWAAAGLPVPHQAVNLLTGQTENIKADHPILLNAYQYCWYMLKES